MTCVHAIAMLFCVEESRKGKLLRDTERRYMRHTFAKTIKKKLKENKHNLIRSL